MGLLGFGGDLSLDVFFLCFGHVMHHSSKLTPEPTAMENVQASIVIL